MLSIEVKDLLIGLLRVIALPALIASMAVSPANTQAKSELSLDELLSIPELSSVASNQQGDIAWVERHDRGWNILVARAPLYQPTQLTNYYDDAGRELFIIGFDADGSVVYRRGEWGVNPTNDVSAPLVQILSVDERSDQPTAIIENVAGRWSSDAVLIDGGSRIIAAEGGRVLAYSASPGAAPDTLFDLRGVVRSVVPSPDGLKLAVTVDLSTLKRGKYGFIVVYDLKTKSLNYIEPGLGVDQDVVWGPDGQRLAFVRFGYEPRTWRFSDHRTGVPFEIVVANADTGDGEIVFKSDTGYGARFNGFSASGYSGLGGIGNLSWLEDDTLVFPYEKTGWKLLYAVSANGGESARLLTPGKMEVRGVASKTDRSGLYYWSNQQDDLARLSLYELSVGTGLAPQRINLPPGSDMVTGFNKRAVFPIGEGNQVAVISVGATSPTQLVLLRDKGSHKLSSGPKSGDAITAKMPSPEVVSFQAPDGVQIQATLYRPFGDKQPNKHKAIVWARGGPRLQIHPVWESQHTRDMTWFYFLSKGYYVLIPNYRGGIGYGLDFREPASYGGRGAGEVQDFIAGANYLADNIPYVDPERIAIIGVSYGGHIVTNALARYDTFAAGISLAGVGDWVVEMEKDFNEVLQFNIPQRLELEQIAYESSAISQIDNWGDEPVLFVHGDNDGSAAMQQSLELYLALKRRGIETEALVFPGETHKFRRTKNIRAFISAADTFLAEHLQTE